MPVFGNPCALINGFRVKGIRFQRLQVILSARNQRITVGLHTPAVHLLVRLRGRHIVVLCVVVRRQAEPRAEVLVARHFR